LNWEDGNPGHFYQNPGKTNYMHLTAGSTPPPPRLVAVYPLASRYRLAARTPSRVRGPTADRWNGGPEDLPRRSCRTKDSNAVNMAERVTLEIVMCDGRLLQSRFRQSDTRRTTFLLFPYSKMEIIGLSMRAISQLREDKITFLQWPAGAAGEGIAYALGYQSEAV
jgi:hypothetical protein